MKKGSLLLIAFVLAEFLFAQNDLIIIPPPQPSATIVKEVIEVGNNYYLAILVNGKETATRIRMRLVDNRDSLVANKMITFRRGPVDGQLEGIFYWDNKINVLSSLYYPGPKRNHLMLTQYDVPTLEEHSNQVIDEAYTPDLYRIPFGYSMSPDSSKVLFYSWSYAIPEDPAKISVFVFDRSLDQLLWKRSYTMPYTNETFLIFDSKLDNKGRVYLLGENYTGNVGNYTNFKEEKILRFALLLEKSASEVREYPFQIEDRIITENILFNMGKDGSLIVAGFYKEMYKKYNDGVFVYRVDPETKKFTLQRSPVGKSLFSGAIFTGSNKQNSSLEKAKGNFQNYVLDHLFIEEDNSVTLIGELREPIDDNSGLFKYRDLLIIQMDQEDKMKTLKRIPKKQQNNQSENNIFSYAHFSFKGEQLIIYNDNKVNHSKEGNKKSLATYKGEDTSNILVRIKKDDSCSIHNISTLMGRSKRFQIIPESCWKVKERLILYGELSEAEKKEGQFVEINLGVLMK